MDIHVDIQAKTGAQTFSTRDRSEMCALVAYLQKKQQQIVKKKEKNGHKELLMHSSAHLKILNLRSHFNK